MSLCLVCCLRECLNRFDNCDSKWPIMLVVPKFCAEHSVHNGKGTVPQRRGAGNRPVHTALAQHTTRPRTRIPMSSAYTGGRATRATRSRRPMLWGAARRPRASPCRFLGVVLRRECFKRVPGRHQTPRASPCAFPGRKQAHPVCPNCDAQAPCRDDPKYQKGLRGRIVDA